VTSARNITLATEKQLASAVASLCKQCEIMRAVHARTGTPPLRDFTADFAGLAKIVTGQQLSTASAAAIWSRVSAAVQPFDAARIAAMDDAGLAALGLSMPKIRTLKAVASAIHIDAFDIPALTDASDDDIFERLTALHGIGPWTADIYLLFALRRADPFPAGDLALQLAAQRLLKLSDRPSPSALTAIAERWRPWRGVAARLLWADYGLHRAAQKSASPRAPAATQAASRGIASRKKSLETKRIR
jgi:DNA-3-methyladenine glycosylase II